MFKSRWNHDGRVAREGCALALAFAFLLVLPPAASAGTVHADAALTLIFREGFESGSLPSTLVAYDENTASGEDTWGVTEFTSHNGTRSAGAAASGTNSADSLPNLVRLGGANATWLARYDNNMSSSLDLDLRNSSTSPERHLGFHWAAQTESWIVDFLSVLVLNGSTWQTLWSQNATLTRDFYAVSLTIPAGVAWVSFHFYSDADNASYVGAFVDDIEVSGVWPPPPVDHYPAGVVPWALILGLAGAGVGAVAAAIWFLKTQKPKGGA